MCVCLTHTLRGLPPQAAGGRQLSCIVKGGMWKEVREGPHLHTRGRGEGGKRVCFLFVALIKVPASWTAPRWENSTP